MIKDKRVILVGRHTSGEIEGVTIVRQKNVTWALNIKDVEDQLVAIHLIAIDNMATLLFQNIPGILGVVLQSYGISYGVMISTPDIAARAAPTIAEYIFPDDISANICGSALKVANGRADVKVVGTKVYIEVESITPFKLHHIEWVA